MKKRKKLKINILEKLFYTCCILSVIYVVIMFLCLIGSPWAGLALLFFIPYTLGTLWGFYLLSIIVFNLYHINKKYLLYFILIIVSIFSVFFAIISITPKTEKLSTAFHYKTHNEVDQKDIVINNNKIYYFKLNNNFVFKRYGLYSMNLDGSGNRLLCNNIITKEDAEYHDENYSHTEFVDFYFIEDDELYYEYWSDYRKINLSSCKITEVGNMERYNYINFSNKNDYAYTYNFHESIPIPDTKSFVESTIVSKSNPKNNKVIEQKKFESVDDVKEIAVDSNFNVCYIQQYKYNNIYKYGLYFNDDDNKIYESDKQLKILLFQDNYLFFYDDDYIYKFDVLNKSMEYTINNSFNDIEIILSDNSDRYFIADGIIYGYNEDEKNYKKIIDSYGLNKLYRSQYYKVSQYDNYLLFEDDHDNILLYNQSTKKCSSYKDVAYHTYYSNEIYMVTHTSGKIKINRIKCNTL